MLPVSFYYTQIKKVAEAIFFIFCVFGFLLTLLGNLNSRNQSQLFAQCLNLLRLCLYDRLKDPGILSYLVNIQFGFLDRSLVLEKYPVLILVKHARVHANSAITIKHLTHDARSFRSIVNLFHVNERFLEARLALNRDEVHAVNCAYADDGGEDTLDTGFAILAEHAGDEEADRRHVDFDVVVGFSVVIIVPCPIESIFLYFVLMSTQNILDAVFFCLFVIIFLFIRFVVIECSY